MVVSSIMTEACSGEQTYHFKRPDPSYPYLQRAFYTLYIMKLDTLPPTPSCRFPPEKQEFLGHADRAAVHIATNICS
jgi:hypothetical protein